MYTEQLLPAEQIESGDVIGHPRSGRKVRVLQTAPTAAKNTGSTQRIGMLGYDIDSGEDIIFTVRKDEDVTYYNE